MNVKVYTYTYNVMRHYYIIIVSTFECLYENSSLLQYADRDSIVAPQKATMCVLHMGSRVTFDIIFFPVLV